MLTGLHHLAQSRSCDAAAREPSQYGECISLPGDISSLDGVNALAAAIAERQPTLDILVNNAGAAWGADFDEFPESGWDKVINIASADGIAVKWSDLHPLVRLTRYLLGNRSQLSNCLCARHFVVLTD